MIHNKSINISKNVFIEFLNNKMLETWSFVWFLRNACKHIPFIHYAAQVNLMRGLQVPIYLEFVIHPCYHIVFFLLVSFFRLSSLFQTKHGKQNHIECYSETGWIKTKRHILPSAKRLHDNLNRIVWFTTENPLTGVK